MNQTMRYTTILAILGAALGAGLLIESQRPKSEPAASIDRPTAHAVQPQAEPLPLLAAREHDTDTDTDEDLPDGTVFDADGLPLFAPVASKASTIEPATLAQRQALALRRTSQFAPSPGVGFSDHIISLDAEMDIDTLGESIADLDGEVLRYLPNLRIATVRIPVARANELTSLAGVGTVADDGDIGFMSTPAKATVQLPAIGSPEHVATNTSLGVAVVDSGVEPHKDLNLA
ncbi:MAG: hypothetical protein AAFZ58_02550, partial [Pseudomonadota bacterium]